MKTINFKFGIGDVVLSIAGTKGVVLILLHDASGTRYYINCSAPQSPGGWFEEHQLALV